MILGLGNDLADIRRIEKLLNRFGNNFKQKVFTTKEIAKANQVAHTEEAASYTKRFAAKEACVKALGTGFGKGIYYKEIEILTLPSGQPSITLHGKALEKLKSLSKAPDSININVSITDEYPYASAVVIISE
ncbi:MAG: holo-ACP synthase [Alphaproteobacteria bacterium]|nr:holo-ACP synthase [Alphaproteobacteria bacterium]